jgi:hypothetical protein
MRRGTLSGAGACMFCFTFRQNRRSRLTSTNRAAKPAFTITTAITKSVRARS